MNNHKVVSLIDRKGKVGYIIKKRVLVFFWVKLCHRLDNYIVYYNKETALSVCEELNSV